MSKKPLIAVTMGDAAGVGPEVIARAWRDPRVHERCRPVVLGHPEVMHLAIDLVGGDCRVEKLKNPKRRPPASTDPSVMHCVPIGSDNVLDVPFGSVDPRTGEAAFQAVVRAISDTLAGTFQGMVTAPISKAALHDSGHYYPGHTELLAERCNVRDFAMMLYLPQHELPQSQNGLGVAHVTLHMALRDVFANLNTGSILDKCRLASHVMSDGFGLDNPRIGVCSLNPHGGETGIFGDEEKHIIKPAVEAAQAEGINASGPWPTDTLMVRAHDGEFDAIVAMYHDQGHIALKLLGMHRAVNITLGLPIVRTSVAHGTAFDRAWRGTAESNGMVAAIVTAAHLAQRAAFRVVSV